MESADEDDEEIPFRPVWAEEEAEPPGKPRRPLPAAAPDYRHPLLTPLARAQDAVARLEARVDAAAAAIAEGLRSRMAYREAAGWLLFAGVGIHPRDLALRDAGLTGSYGPAALAGRLEAELPATTADGYEFAVAPFLPFWVAPETRLNRLAPRTGLDWMTGFLDCVAEAATAGLDELGRLQSASEKGKKLAATTRSKLPAAFEAVVRAPVTTAGSLAKTLDITPQGALGLLRQLLKAELIREATGRASWRAFVLV